MTTNGLRRRLRARTDIDALAHKAGVDPTALRRFTAGGINPTVEAAIRKVLSDAQTAHD